MPHDLAALAALAERAVDAARAEILPRFRKVGVETKADGSPVTEADRAAERAMRRVLQQGDPGAAILGEELGAEGDTARGAAWVIDPIDGTIAFARGIPLFSTLLARLEDGVPVLGVIDLPALGERTVGWTGGGVRRNGEPVRCSTASDLQRAMVAHGDGFCFVRAGEQEAYLRMARELPLFRGYTDGFGHAQVLAGAVDAMVDLDLNPWDAAATQALVPAAGGRCETIRYPEQGKIGLVFGAPALVEALVAHLARKPAG
ncbi:MAG: histidinol phosphate phosphatase [Planctomycetes bacterium]|nr:histidinol phosphate phosphatase [Planctomycetota bacterium]MEB2344123.1 histidinol phosphate phosphatase [Deltaproteobacteria bacterium]